VGPELAKSAALYTYIGDTPACDVLGFRMNISGLKFRRYYYPDLYYAVFPSASTFVSLHMDFAAMRDTSTIMYISSVTEDTYDQAVLTLQLPKIVFYDTSVDSPIRVIDGTLSNDTPALTLQPLLNVTQAKLNVVKIDFDMDKSLQFDTTGQVTKDIIPVFSASIVNQAADTTYGTFDDLFGFVTSVSPTPSGSFIGSFNLQNFGSNGQTLPISVKAETNLAGVPSLASVETGRIAEIRATVDKSGNIVAQQVEFEDRAVIEDKRVAFLGTVLPTPVKDASGNVTQFKMYLRSTTPDRSSEVVQDSVLTVNVPSGTVFQTSPRPENLTPLVFDATSITVGQELLVHGQYTLVTGQPTVVDTTSIYLRPQTLQGGMSSLVNVGSDGKSGAFWFTGCSTLLQTTPIMVMTTNLDTAFISLFGLADINPQAMLHVRGFPFYVKSATVIRGIPVPAGTLVLFSTQVRQIL
jgi:hypothetical protein